MNNKKLIFVSAYCQNSYQEERIENFVKSQVSEIINPLFNTNIKFNKSLDNKLHNISQREKDFMYNADEVLLLIGSLDSNLSENKLKMHKVEEYSIILNKPLKYVYLHQSGCSMGKTKPIGRREIFNSSFYKYLHEEAI
jgi:hypothetical protein